jgi:uncharacterized peroxidase-related enzyme
VNAQINADVDACFDRFFISYSLFPFIEQAGLLIANRYWIARTGTAHNLPQQHSFFRDEDCDMADTLNVDTHSSASISRLHVPGPEAVSADIRELIERHHGENWIRALVLNPATAQRFTQYFEKLFGADGRLPIEERELIAVIVSRTNGCGLCAIHHAHALGEALLDRVKARRIALDYHLAHLSPRQLALAEIAETITTSPRAISPQDFERLRRAGLEDADILEAIETASWFNHTNRIFIATGVVPDEKYFSALA